MHKIHANINAAKTNTIVTSKMKTVTGWGPDKMSLAMEYTPLLSEEVDRPVDVCVSPGRVSVVCRWQSKDLNLRGSEDNPSLAGSNALEQ